MAGKQWIVPEVNKTSSFENQHNSIPLPSTVTKRLFWELLQLFPAILKRCDLTNTEKNENQ